MIRFYFEKYDFFSLSYARIFKNYIRLWVIESETTMSIKAIHKFP